MPAERLLRLQPGFRLLGASLVAMVLLAATLHVGCRNPSVQASDEHGESASQRRAALDSAEAARRASLDDPAGIRLVTRGLISDDPLVSGTAVSRLMGASPEEAIRVLSPALTGEDVPVSGRMLASWWATRASTAASARATWPVCDWFETTEAPGARSLAAAACAERMAAAGRSLERFANDPHWMVRCRVVTALSDDAKTSPRVRDWIARRGAEDPHPTVRRAARRPSAGRAGTADAEINDRPEPQQP